MENERFLTLHLEKRIDGQVNILCKLPPNLAGTINFTWPSNMQSLLPPGSKPSKWWQKA